MKSIKEKAIKWLNRNPNGLTIEYMRERAPRKVKKFWTRPNNGGCQSCGCLLTSVSDNGSHIVWSCYRCQRAVNTIENAETNAKRFAPTRDSLRVAYFIAGNHP